MSEIELKLELDPSNLHLIRGLPWLNRMVEQAAVTHHLKSVNFDTDTFRIRDNGFTLRVRTNGTGNVQTVKSETSSPFVRGEWEEAIEGDTPQWQLVKKSDLPKVIGRKLFSRSIKPVFTTDIVRESSILSYSNAKIEFSIDQGTIQTGDQVEPVSEIEFEIKDGDPAILMNIARRLAAEIPVRYGFRSKAERGYNLPVKQRAVHASPIILESGETTGESFKIIAMSCLHHFARNDHAIDNADSEGIHQMRVGIRRLRAALSIFKSAVIDAETATVKANLKWMLSQLGNARDTDVFLRETVAPLLREKQRRDFSILQTDLESQRKDAFQTAKEAVHSDRYRHLLLQAVLWIESGRWMRNVNSEIATQRERPIIDFACDVLDDRTKKVVKKLKNLASLDPVSRHELRIAIKKLRYAVEFFGSLYDGAHTTYGKHLKELQDALGQLNDIAVHERFSERLVHSGNGLRGRQIAFAIGYVTGRENIAASVLMRNAIKAGKQLGNASRFWK